MKSYLYFKLFFLFNYLGCMFTCWGIHCKYYKSIFRNRAIMTADMPGEWKLKNLIGVIE